MDYGLDIIELPSEPIMTMTTINFETLTIFSEYQIFWTFDMEALTSSLLQSKQIHVGYQLSLLEIVS